MCVCVCVCVRERERESFRRTNLLVHPTPPSQSQTKTPTTSSFSSPSSPAVRRHPHSFSPIDTPFFLYNQQCRLTRGRRHHLLLLSLLPTCALSACPFTEHDRGIVLRCAVAMWLLFYCTHTSTKQYSKEYARPFYAHLTAREGSKETVLSHIFKPSHHACCLHAHVYFQFIYS